MAAASKAAHDRHPSVRARVACWPQLPLPDCLSLVHDSPFVADVWEALARNDRTPPEVLLEMARLVTDPDYTASLDAKQVDEVRGRLCSSRSTPAEAMRLLAAVGVKVWYVEENPSWPPEVVVEQAFADAHRYDAETAEEHAALDALERKVRDLGETGSWGAALATMLESEFHSLVQCAKASHFVDPARLAAWVRSHPDYDHHYGYVPENPATPTEILLGWVREGKYLREMMRNPSLPDEVLEAIGNDKALAALRIRALRATPEWRGETPALRGDEKTL